MISKIPIPFSSTKHPILQGPPSQKSNKSYRAGCVQNLQHALLPIDFHLLPITIFDRRVVFLYEDPLYELHSKSAFYRVLTESIRK